MYDTNFNSINPYMRNAGIMRKFFSKPIVLVTAIAYTVKVLLNFGNDIYNSVGNGEINIVSFDFISIMVLIAFYLFYFGARSKKQQVSFKAPLNLLTVASVILLVIFSLGVIVILLFSVLISSSSLSIGVSPDNLTLTVICAVAGFAAVVIISILQLIAMLIMLSSFGKSMSSIYLYKKGSKFYGITTILLAIISLASVIFSLTVLPDVMNDLDATFTSIFNSSAVYSDISASAFSYNIYFNAASSFVQFVIYILLAVFAFSYHKYIKNVSESINVGSPAADKESAETPIYYTTDNIQSSAVNVKIPVDFEPKPVFGEEQSNSPYEQQTPDIQSPQNDFASPTAQQLQEQNYGQSRNPYSSAGQQQNSAHHNIPNVIVCKNCGTQCPANTIFCGHCGTKLN